MNTETISKFKSHENRVSEVYNRIVKVAFGSFSGVSDEMRVTFLKVAEDVVNLCADTFCAGAIAYANEADKDGVFNVVQAACERGFIPMKSDLKEVSRLL